MKKNLFKLFFALIIFIVIPISTRGQELPPTLTTTPIPITATPVPSPTISSPTATPVPPSPTVSQASTSSNSPTTTTAPTTAVIVYTPVPTRKKTPTPKPSPTGKQEVLGADDENKTYSIIVKVVNQKNKPIENADVTLKEEKLEGKTNKMGKIQFEEIPEGDYTIIAEYKKEKKETSVALYGNDPEVSVSITLTEKPSLISFLLKIILLIGISGGTAYYFDKKNKLKNTAKS